MVEQAGKLNFERNAYRYAEQHPGQTIPVTKLWREASSKILGHNISQEGEHAATMDSRLMLWDQYMHEPGYGSGYLVGWAAAPKLLERLEADPAAFQETYRVVLAKGDSLTSEKFLEAFGIDINQPEFWKDRLNKMAKDVGELERAHKASIMGAFVNHGTGNNITLPKRVAPRK